MKRVGLTLMELLTVISVLATLAALLYPVYLRVRTRTDIMVCADQLRQIGQALKIYAHDHGDDSPYGMPEDLASLLPDYLRSKDFLVCPTFRKAYPEVVESLHQLVKDSKWYLPPSNAWSSYFLMMPRALDKPPIITVTFREVYTLRGDQIPIVFCDTHWGGCPTSNREWRGTPKSYLVNCRALANPDAPYVVLRWSGQVNFVRARSRSTDVILLTY